MSSSARVPYWNDRDSSVNNDVREQRKAKEFSAESLGICCIVCCCTGHCVWACLAGLLAEACCFRKNQHYHYDHYEAAPNNNMSTSTFPTTTIVQEATVIGIEPSSQMMAQQLGRRFDSMDTENTGAYNDGTTLISSTAADYAVAPSAPLEDTTTTIPEATVIAVEPLQMTSPGIMFDSILDTAEYGGTMALVPTHAPSAPPSHEELQYQCQ